MTSVEAPPKYTARSPFTPLPAKSPAHWQWPLQEVFGDLRVRSGIKFGLAALLALYIAEFLRLQHPNWAILTVLSMMSVPYVGSITILAVTQVAGTIAGALVGIWLVGDYASTPAIFLTLFFFALAFSGYKFGQAPASPVSLGYYLVGFTTIADHFRTSRSRSGLAGRLKSGVRDSGWRAELAARNDRVMAAFRTRGV